MTWTLPPDTHGLIFDCDGTLADTMPIHFRAWQTMLTRHGIPFTEKRFYELGGMPTSRIIRLLSEETGVAVHDVDAMVHEKESHFLSFLHDVRRIDSVVSIAELHRGQLPIAVASGGYRDVVRQTLSHIGILDWFPAIVCAEDTPRHKPEPDVFLEAARRIGLPATKCVVFEDTDIGLEAAHRAGAKAVDVRGWK
jgi:beta-phosphoglucomutase-like phosphatase (HAD superfamily)